MKDVTDAPASTSASSASRWLLYAYLLILPFKTLPIFSDNVSQVTPAEFLYVPIGFLALGHSSNLLKRNWWTGFDFLVIAWFLVEAFSMVLNGVPNSSVRELAATLYLVCLYFSIRLLVEVDYVPNMVNAIIVSSSVLAVLAICGWLVASVIQEETIYVFSLKSYPYLGNVYRAKALTGSPNMLVSFLMVGSVFCWARLLTIETNRLIYSAAMGVMLLGMLLTFSRDVLIVLGSMAMILSLSLPSTHRSKRCVRLLLLFVTLLAASAYIFLSHVVVTPNSEATVREMGKAEYINSDIPLLTIGLPDSGYALYPSIYLELKKAAYRAFLDSKGLGLGGGAFNQYLLTLKSRGLYPADFSLWDPHSTYFGVLAEHGLIGLLTVCVILVFISRKSLIRLQFQKQRDFVSIGFAGAIVGIIIEGICVDVMNFRQYWVLFALAATFYQRNNEESLSQRC